MFGKGGVEGDEGKGEPILAVLEILCTCWIIQRVLVVYYAQSSEWLAHSVFDAVIEGS